MIIQVYTAQSVSEARALAGLGVDHVGVTISRRGLPGEIEDQVGKDIVSALADSAALVVALTVETDLEAIRSFAREIQPDILHLCGDTNLVGPDEVARLGAWLDEDGMSVDLMQAIGVTGEGSMDEARAFEEHVDWLILDSYSEAVEGIGAAGTTHDWEVSRRIVRASSVPVILAGGLGPDNVAEAIAAVGPAGVDSLTHTNHYRADGSFEKDIDAVAAFVSLARSSGSSLGDPS